MDECCTPVPVSLRNRFTPLGSTTDDDERQQFRVVQSSVFSHVSSNGHGPLTAGVSRRYGQFDHESKVRLKASGDGEERMVRGNLLVVISENNRDLFMLQEHWLTPMNLCLFEKHFGSYFVFGSSALC